MAMAENRKAQLSMRKRERKEELWREKSMSVLVLVSNITLIFLQDYVTWSCGDVACLSPPVFMWAKCKEKGYRWKESKDRRIQAERVREKGGVNKGSRIGKDRKGKESKQRRSSAELLLGGQESNMIQRQEWYRERWRGRQTHWSTSRLSILTCKGEMAHLLKCSSLDSESALLAKNPTLIYIPVWA